MPDLRAVALWFWLHAESGTGLEAKASKPTVCLVSYVDVY